MHISIEYLSNNYRVVIKWKEMLSRIIFWKLFGLLPTTQPQDQVKCRLLLNVVV